MAAISDHWTSFKNLAQDSVPRQRVQHVITTADFQFLCSVATQAKKDLEDSFNPGLHMHNDSLSCTIDVDRFTNGMENVVFEIRFPDLESWIARVRLPDETSEPDIIETSMLSEIATMRFISARTEIPVPRVYGFDVSGDNPFGFRYIFLQTLPGQLLNTTFSESVPVNQQDKVADQLAKYYFQLSRLRFDRIGRLWSGTLADDEVSIIPISGMRSFATSLEYFYTLRSEENRAIKAEHSDDMQWITAARILEQALTSMIVKDYIYGPFPLCHIDLHYHNILLDEDFNITGILDWGGAQTVPLEQFLISPDFTTFPGLSPEENAPIIAFREKFATALRCRELADSRSVGEDDSLLAPPPISDLIGTPLWDIVYRCTYSFHWRAMTDAQLVLQHMFKNSEEWENYIAFHAPMRLSRPRS